MPVDDAYATAVIYRGIIGKPDTGQDLVIDADLKAMSRVVERICERFFNKDANPVARIYYPVGYSAGNPEAENPWRDVPGSRSLTVDDMAEVPTSIVVDDRQDGSFVGDAAWVAADYQCLPLNAAVGPEPKPYTRIHVPIWSKQIGFRPGSMVQVTTRWGYPAVPAGIVRYTCWMTAILRLETPRATERIPEAMAAAVGESESGREIINMLTRTYKRRGRLFA